MAKPFCGAIRRRAAGVGRFGLWKSHISEQKSLSLAFRARKSAGLQLEPAGVAARPASLRSLSKRHFDKLSDGRQAGAKGAIPMGAYLRGRRPAERRLHWAPYAALGRCGRRAKNSAQEGANILIRPAAAPPLPAPSNIGMSAWATPAAAQGTLSRHSRRSRLDTPPPVRAPSHLL